MPAQGGGARATRRRGGASRWSGHLFDAQPQTVSPCEATATAQPRRVAGLPTCRPKGRASGRSIGPWAFHRPRSAGIGGAARWPVVCIEQRSPSGRRCSGRQQPAVRERDPALAGCVTDRLGPGLDHHQTMWSAASATVSRTVPASSWSRVAARRKASRRPLPASIRQHSRFGSRRRSLDVGLLARGPSRRSEQAPERPSDDGHGAVDLGAAAAAAQAGRPICRIFGRWRPSGGPAHWYRRWRRCRRSGLRRLGPQHSSAGSRAVSSDRSALDRPRRPVFGRAVSPGTTNPQDVENARDHAAIVGSAGSGSVAWREGLDDRPGHVVQPGEARQVLSDPACSRCLTESR